MFFFVGVCILNFSKEVVTRPNVEAGLREHGKDKVVNGKWIVQYRSFLVEPGPVAVGSSRSFFYLETDKAILFGWLYRTQTLTGSLFFLLEYGEIYSSVLDLLQSNSRRLVFTSIDIDA